MEKTMSLVATKQTRSSTSYKMILNETSGKTSCIDVCMESGFVAVFLGFEFIWYLLFREQTQASENPRERIQRCDILHERHQHSLAHYYKNRHLL